MDSQSSVGRPVDGQSVATDSQWHAMTLEEIYESLESSSDGLSEDTAKRRLDRYGQNELELEDAVSPFRVFLEQLTSLLIWLLLLAAAIMVVVGQHLDAGLIVAVVFLITFFGFVQDYRAEQSITALRDLSTRDAIVIRDGEKVALDSRNVVPGDLVRITGGDIIPADGRVVSESNLDVDESPLTGESVAVTKSTAVLPKATPLAERRNMVYKDTIATSGAATVVVTDTGMDTEVGSIATALEAAAVQQTPFQIEMDRLAKTIALGVALAVGIVAAVEIFVGETDLLTIFLAAVSIAVAAVPEGMPAVVTLSLALGARRMAAKNALVRRLPIAEALGSVDVICTDKTGTLTEEEMTVQRLYAGGDVYEFADGESWLEQAALDDEPVHPLCVRDVLKCGLLCNDADIGRRESGDRSYLGEPTEVALFAAASKAGMNPLECRAAYPRLDELEFTSTRKRMTTVHRTPDGDAIAYVKGAPEVVLERCDRELIGGEVRELSTERRREITKHIETFAEDALRVLGFAYRPVEDTSSPASEAIENELVFLGLQGMLDPPRSEVPAAIDGCQEAGIDVTMITGDNPVTARAIGERIGVANETVLTGGDIEGMDEDELRAAVASTAIFARTTPEHKVRILQTLQELGHTVAMTGDGVNDAPAVKNANVGVSMGIRGTDVTEQASDIVLLDDNFATIHDAVREGRRIFDNVRKFVNYLLSGNAGLVLSIFTGSVAGLGLIITPLQVLWINLVTESAPALTMGIDPEAEDVMERPPRPIDEGVITDRILTSIVGIAVFMMVTILPLFYLHRSNLELAQTMVFTSLIVFEGVRIQAIRWRYELGVLSNPWLVVAVGVTFALQLVILYTPIGTLFGVTPLGAVHWLQIGVSVAVFVVLIGVFVRVQDRVFDRY
ncbi:cation-translocating P-type ATPase [Natrarchaeobius sp. A-rgal3]|uniref:cation-translocating P-type ATPase n=1 Tax=Natrarchaeobius versutus TaxID=1679078 RepID=UPI003510B0DA